MSSSGCTERSSDARALASEIAPVASSQARSVSSEGGVAFRRSTAARARERSSLEARTKRSRAPERREAAVMARSLRGEQLLAQPLVDLQRRLQRHLVPLLHAAGAHRVEEGLAAGLLQVDDEDPALV